MYSFSPYEGGGSLFGDLGSLVGGVGSIVRAFQQPQTPEPYTPPSTSIFNIPGYDIVSPIQSEVTTGKQQTCAAMQSPFHGAPGVRAAIPQPHVVANPTTGKAQWFVPAKHKGWKMTHVGNNGVKRCRCRGKR